MLLPKTLMIHLSVLMILSIYLLIYLDSSSVEVTAEDSYDSSECSNDTDEPGEKELYLQPFTYQQVEIYID